MPTLFVVLLALTASGKHQGVEGKVRAVFQQARRSGFWPHAHAVHRSAVTKARAQLSWNAFEQVHQEAGKLAYAVWPTREAKHLARAVGVRH